MIVARSSDDVVKPTLWVLVKRRARNLWQAFLFLIAVVMVLGFIAGVWYLDHVRFTW